jgi:hypothetical protein
VYALLPYTTRNAIEFMSLKENLCLFYKNKL